MPTLLESHRQDISKLKERYQSLPWLVKWLFPSRKSVTLLREQPSFGNENKHVLEFCRALLNEGSSIKRWLFSFFDNCLEEFLLSPLMIAVKELNCSELLNGAEAQDNFDSVVEHQDSGSMVNALLILNDAGLLNGAGAQDNFEAVVGHQDSWWVAEALCLLNTAGLLTGGASQANRVALATHRDLRGVVTILRLLSSANLLLGHAAQGNFDTLILHSAILFSTGAVPWEQIPAHMFTSERFAVLTDICRRHTDNPAAGRDLVIAYINCEIPDMNLPAAGGLKLNVGQSTHTASVHQSVSESAKRLLASYGNQILGRQLDGMIRTLSKWLDAQPDSSLEVKTAKRCLRRLIAPPYFYTDPCSQVSMKQLLALFWIAIHDDTRRIGTLDDAKLRLIEGLYESQREYNLSEKGVDDGRDVDESSCPPGTFNKMVEKGQGVHPDMVINFISMAGFSLKLPWVVRDEAMAYLRSDHANSNLSSLIEAIKADGNANSVGPIWAEIEAVVAERMFNEFGSLFGNVRTSRRFESDIATGEFLALNPENLIELDRLIDQVSQDGARAARGGGRDGFFTAATPSAQVERDISAKGHCL